MKKEPDENKRLLEKLRQLEEEKKTWRKSRFITNVVDQMLTIIDRNYVYESVNHAYCKARGQQRDEVVGKSVTEVWGKESFETIIRPHLEKCFSGRTTSYENWFRFDGKKRRCYEVTYNPYRDNECGHVTHAVVVTHDITSLKRAQAEMEKAYGRLEKQVHQRAAALEKANGQLCNEMEERKRMEKNLHQAQKMEAIGTLAGGIAHDFNNLLMGIQGNISLMYLDVGIGHPFYENVQSIEQLVDSGANLTRQLLGFARGGKYVVKPVNLNEVAAQAAALFKRTRRTVRIHENYDTDVHMVCADRGQIEQVLVNLYLNAWQAMAEQGDIYIETQNVVIDEKVKKPFEIRYGDYVRVSVTDTGKGIDPTIAHRIFEPFFTTKKIGCGSGLGLASVFGIVKNHGGIVDFESKVGRGTTFNVYLPVSLETVCSPQIESNEILKGSETILLVEDDPMLLDISMKMLTKMGYTVLTADCGEKGIEIFKYAHQQIDLVIISIVSSDVVGVRILDHLYRINSYKKVLVACTSQMDEEFAASAGQKYHGFIQKPFGMKELSRSIRDVIDNNCTQAAV